MPGNPHESGKCNGVPDCGDCMVSYRLGLESVRKKERLSRPRAWLLAAAIMGII